LLRMPKKLKATKKEKKPVKAKAIKKGKQFSHSINAEELLL